MIIVVEAFVVARETECLAWETSKADVEFGNRFRSNLRDIALYRRCIAKVLPIRSGSLLVPFRNEYCFKILPECLLETKANASDSSEEID